MTRQDILDTALKCVNGDRDQQYGSPEDSFKQIAEYWTTYLKAATMMSDSDDNCLRSKDVAAMLALLKIARIACGKPKNDNWVDLAGYAACGGEIEGID